MSAHDLVPFPITGAWAEVRMIYCRKCGATQPVEAGDRPPLGACLADDSTTPQGVLADVEDEPLPDWAPGPPSAEALAKWRAYLARGNTTLPMAENVS